jgi:acetylornithine/succinyldiaminopimelate/putrescine aminotransferase
MVPGTHGSTFGGNPLAMRSANAVIDLLLEDGFLDDLKDRIDYFDKKGSGMLRGFELNENVSASDFASLAREKGLLLVGAAENTIRLLPPLNTSEAEINEAFNTLSQVILALKKKAD